jgi:hypothetical protein
MVNWWWREKGSNTEGPSASLRASSEEDWVKKVLFDSIAVLP